MRAATALARADTGTSRTAIRQAFVAALAAIQESADGCKDGGGTINPN